MRKLWRKNGRLIADNTGAVVRCETCPCGLPCCQGCLEGSSLLLTSSGGNLFTDRNFIIANACPVCDALDDNGFILDFQNRCGSLWNCGSTRIPGCSYYFEEPGPSCPCFGTVCGSFLHQIQTVLNDTGDGFFWQLLAIRRCVGAPNASYAAYTSPGFSKADGHTYESMCQFKPPSPGSVPLSLLCQQLFSDNDGRLGCCWTVHFPVFGKPLEDPPTLTLQPVS